MDRIGKDVLKRAHVLGMLKGYLDWRGLGRCGCWWSLLDESSWAWVAPPVLDGYRVSWWWAGWQDGSRGGGVVMVMKEAYRPVVRRDYMWRVVQSSL